MARCPDLLVVAVGSRGRPGGPGRQTHSRFIGIELHAASGAIARRSPAAAADHAALVRAQGLADARAEIRCDGLGRRPLRTDRRDYAMIDLNPLYLRDLASRIGGSSSLCCHLAVVPTGVTIQAGR